LSSPSPAESPLLLAVDGDSLVHRAYHGMAGSDHRDAAGRPVWALRGLVSFLASTAARMRPDAILVGFDSHVDSVRKADYADYKAHRPDKPAELQAQLDEAPLLLADCGIGVASATGYEADDVLASAAEVSRRDGWRCVLVTSDRDAFALVCENTSVLRVSTGGAGAWPLLTPADLPDVCGVDPQQYRDLAALRGDVSDNLRGVDGIGGKIAARLLGAFGSVEAAYAAVDEDRHDEIVAAIGVAAAARFADPAGREAVARNRRLMAMRPDLTLPPLETCRLPLSPATVRTALRARDITLGPSLWALVGAPPPTANLPGLDVAPVQREFHDRPAPRRRLRPRDPSEDQLALF
jgi:5'-3' exonuclease